MTESDRFVFWDVDGCGCSSIGVQMLRKDPNAHYSIDMNSLSDEGEEEYDPDLADHEHEREEFDGNFLQEDVDVASDSIDDDETSVRKRYKLKKRKKEK